MQADLSLSFGRPHGQFVYKLYLSNSHFAYILAYEGALLGPLVLLGHKRI
jgi:hypothetical protein